MKATKLERHWEKAWVRHPPQVHQLIEYQIQKTPIVAWGNLNKTSDMYTSGELKQHAMN